ncbi:hypothetical protein HMI56_002352 [Coelomomyces lativittatus]|nr:hypothetical protein HMI56_002352 [Coelomomyces lativittatus]
MVLQRWSYDPSWTCKFLYKGKVLVNEKALDMYPGLESGAGGFIHVMFGTPVSTLVTTSSSSTESPTSSTPLPTTTTTPVSPMEAFGKNAAFWGDIRQVVEKHGLMAGYSKTDVTKIVNAFSHALFQLYK